jgi:hypothetical protein
MNIAMIAPRTAAIIVMNVCSRESENPNPLNATYVTAYTITMNIKYNSITFNIPKQFNELLGVLSGHINHNINCRIKILLFSLKIFSIITVDSVLF